ncbi:MAG: arylsulfatase [Cyclobacteriaceae bacterium]|nr:arylsulfatase [Cyclobacteriaceae bacterium]
MKAFLLEMMGLVVMLPLLSACKKDQAENAESLQKPNIIVVLADDMGYSDLGCTGSEIATPNLDRLAQNGLLFTHAYNASRCCPSRASLLTRLYQHRAGIGFMNGDMGLPQYQGYLNDKCVTIAEVLQQSGYRTLMSGKWHVGDKPEQWPSNRGFDQFYGIPAGGGLYFYPSKFVNRPIYRNGEAVVPDSGSFYSTDNFTDEAIDFIDKAKETNQPFFLYLAYIAPHFPLQALPEDIRKYQGRYDQGYAATRDKRLARQKELNIVDRDVVLSPEDFPDWEQVEDKAKEIRKMEVYAAQVDRLDQNIGKLIDFLRHSGQLENTVIFFLSDNGASAETFERAPEAEIGTAHSFTSYGQHWANVSNTPYRMYKSMEHEGGIITPLIVYWPKGIAQIGKLIDTPVHITDIMPTCLELANARYPEQFNAKDILPCDGNSILPLFHSPNTVSNRHFFWEHMGNGAVRVGHMKLVRRHHQPWELYDLGADATETYDLSGQHPQQAEELQQRWQKWADELGVQPWPITDNKKVE